jgi:glycogen debranching enzyme
MPDRPRPSSTGDTSASAWLQSSESASLGDPKERVMLVSGQTFCLSDRHGVMSPGLPHGLFIGDTRVMSGLRLTIDGHQPEALGVAEEGGAAASFVGRTGTSVDRRRLLVVRRRKLAPVLCEEIELRSSVASELGATVRVDVAADFADLFSVKQGQPRPHGRRRVYLDGDRLCFDWVLGVVRRTTSLRVVADGGAGEVELDEGGFTWTVAVPPRASARATWTVDVALGDEWVDRSLGPLMHSHAAPSQSEWIEDAPTLDTDDPALARAYRRSLSDLAALRLFDPSGLRLPVVAAGAPWFMTLFGRDSLWTSLMALAVDPTLALGVLDALAHLQGSDVNARTEEEPGRIMHETRFDGANTLALEGGTTYYGSVDATPLFVVLLGELARWGLPSAELSRLLPHADRALAWIEDFGDRDGDGYVEYLRANPRGLANQGWKDSWDAMRRHDGRLADAPIALSEVQGYVYTAYRARAAIAARAGDEPRAARWQRKAVTLKRAFNRDFWLDDLGWFAMGLDRDKRPIDGLGSNMGHCLWSGIVDDEHAAATAERLGAPDLWTGWGIRTLAASEVAFDPTSYHCGSVWPHDTAIGIAGIAAAGRRDTTFRMVEGLLAAADRSEGRLPELFLGVARADVATPVPYPTSCSPQAWSAASPLLLLRVLLGLEPDVPAGVVRVAPMLPPDMSTLDVRGLRLWDGRFDVRCRGDQVDVSGLPNGRRVDLA